jgi:hypothetical protein
MKVIYTQEVISIHIQQGRDMLTGGPLAQRFGGRQAPLSGGLHRPLLPPLHLRQHRFRLGQPERHVHGLIEVDGRGELSAGLFPLAHCDI